VTPDMRSQQKPLRASPIVRERLSAAGGQSNRRHRRACQWLTKGLRSRLVRSRGELISTRQLQCAKAPRDQVCVAAIAAHHDTTSDDASNSSATPNVRRGSRPGRRGLPPDRRSRPSRPRMNACATARPMCRTDQPDQQSSMRRIVRHHAGAELGVAPALISASARKAPQQHRAVVTVYSATPVLPPATLATGIQLVSAACEPVDAARDLASEFRAFEQSGASLAHRRDHQRSLCLMKRGDLKASPRVIGHLQAGAAARPA